MVFLSSVRFLSMSHYYTTNEKLFENVVLMPSMKREQMEISNLCGTTPIVDVALEWNGWEEKEETH